MVSGDVSVVFAINLFSETKNKISNYYEKLKKDREIKKKRDEKRKKAEEKRELLKNKKLEQKQKIDNYYKKKEEISYNFWTGSEGLAKTFWLYFIVANMFLNFISLIAMESEGLIIFVFIVWIVWNIFAILGVFRAADIYKAEKIVSNKSGFDLTHLG